MSEQADRQQSKRQKFAAPGGFHDRLVRLLRVALPSVIGVVLALLLVSPFSESRELSFVLAKDEVNKAMERLKITEALYRGEDSQGRPFSLRAESAVQKSSDEPLVRMKGLSAQLLMSDGPAHVAAAQASYDMGKETVRSVGPLSFNNSSGYAITANNVLLYIKSKQLESFGGVNGSTRVGTFSAGKLRADLNSRIVRLEGGARLQINQGAIR
jgi:lipopolysaccharide export system protein LptC